MPVKYFAPKVYVILIDFPRRDNRGQDNEQSEGLLRPHLFIHPDPGLNVPELMQVFPENAPLALTLISKFINNEMYTDN